MSSARRTFAVILLTLGLLIAVNVSFRANSESKIKTPKKPVRLLNLEVDIKTELARGPQADTKKIKSDIAQLLRADTLNDNALVLYGSSVVLQEGWENFDSDIFEVVKSRNPRNRKNLQSLLVYSFTIGDLGTAFQVLNLQYQLNFDQRPEMLKLLDSIYHSEGGPLIINDQLSHRPYWETDFLNVQSKKITDESLEYFIETITQSMVLSNDVYQLRTPMIYALSSLVQAKKIDHAIELWERTTAKAEIQNPRVDSKLRPVQGKEALETLNYNPNVLELASPPPFNWLLLPNKNVQIETTPEDNRYISFSGNKQTTVARQYFVPQQGPLSLTVKAEYYHKRKQGTFTVRLNCITAQGYKSEFDLNETPDNKTALNVDFDGFGPDCRLAVLYLLAKPGIFNERISMTLSSIAVTPAL